MVKRSLSSIYTSLNVDDYSNQNVRDTDILYFKVIKRDIERKRDVVSLSVIVIV